VEAQTGLNGRMFTWVEFTPQFHSYLIRSALRLVSDRLVPEGTRPPAGLVKKVKKVLFVFLLELLSEGPRAGFFDPRPTLRARVKAMKTKKRREARKKTRAARMEKGKSAGSSEPVGTPEAPPSCKRPRVHSPTDKSSFFSSAEEELKILDFKSRKGALSAEEAQRLAQLRMEGGSSGGAGPGRDPGPVTRLGADVPVKLT
jgi:hypothetical protein